MGAQEDSRTCTIVPAGGGAGAASQESLSCWVCLDVQGRPTRSRRLELVRACACRGSSGWAHMGCLISVAKHNVRQWQQCPTCKQAYTGKVLLGLAQARFDLHRSAERDDPRRLDACQGLAIAQQQMGQYRAARPLLEQVVESDIRMRGPNDRIALNSKCNLALVLQETGERGAAKALFVSCHEIAGIRLAFFSRWQRYRC